VPVEHPFTARHSNAGPRLVILICFCAFLFFYGINTGDFWRAEGLRALVAKGVLDSGNWIVPTLYGQPLFSKPPLFYVCVAIVSEFAGEISEWTARLPSALAATTTVLLYFWYFSRQLGRNFGLVAALILPASLMWLDKATLAEIDMLHLAWTTAAILFFFRAVEAAEERLHVSGIACAETVEHPRNSAYSLLLQARYLLIPTRFGRLSFELASRPRVEMNWGSASASCVESAASTSVAEWFWWMAALFCVTGGFLTKWTAPCFFYLTAVALLYFRGELRLLLGRPHLVGLSLSVALCLSWAAAAIALSGWRPFYETVSREAFARVAPGTYGGAYRWYEVPAYPLKIFATNLPWSAFALLAVRPAFAALWDERGRRFLQALHCWLWPSLVLWSFVAEHTPRHSFPMYPAIAGLAAMVWWAWLTGRLGWRWRVRPAVVLATLLAAWLGVKFVYVHAVVPARNNLRQPRGKGETLAAAVPSESILHLLQLKDRDEGILYYYGRAVRRLGSPEELTDMSHPAHCLLDQDEWKEMQENHEGEVLLRMPDETGQTIVLVRIDPRPK
jgi:4-amino-4-deoxy-L-arabinose transferase-like glycosyltransferase